MKITPNRKSRGIILVVTLATIFILALILTSYLVLVSNQNTAVARSQAWNQAIPVLESGIEEALTQIHFAGTNAVLLTSNNWTYGLDGLYHKSRTFADGSYFNVTIQAANNPIVISTGYVPFMARSSSTNTNYITRRVKLIAQPLSTGSGGLIAKGGITFSSSGAYLDSFDSSNPLYSTLGMYDVTKRQANGKASTTSAAAGAITVGSSSIYGSAVTGPGGTVVVGSGSIGDATWNATQTGIQPGATNNDANMQFNDISAPFPYGTGATINKNKTVIAGVTYQYVLDTGNYNIKTLSLNSGVSLAVTGNVVLYINGSLSIGGGSQIYIAPGASLTVYVNGDVSIAGNGVVNATQAASQSTWYGMPGCTSFGYSGGAAWIGTIYAPEADFTYSGGADATGSFTANSIKISGGVGIHYDQSLVVANPEWVVASWNEF